ncbi:MAG: dipeptidase [Clostridia bacterium]|nr:dipeptidase [Clostridia bacterium]
MPFPIADAHCDFLYGAMEYGYDLNTLRREQVVHLPYMQKGNVKLQLFAVWYDQKLRTPPLQQGLTMVDCYKRMLAGNPALVPFTRDFDPQGDKIATVLTIEGGEVCEGSLAMLRIFHELGVRAMTMTWNENNELAGAAMARRQKGLTLLGLEMLREMNRLGVAMDVSHLSDQGIRDALEISTCPIFASHSNARALKDSPRCLPDDLIRDIALQGGVIGVNFYAPQLTENKLACIDDIVRHILHIVSIGGVDCCCFGSDFDGMSTYPKDLKNGADFPALCQALLKAGFNEEQVSRIAYWNLHRYLSQFV